MNRQHFRRTGWLWSLVLGLLPLAAFAQTNPPGYEEQLVLTEKRNFVLCNIEGTKFRATLENKSDATVFQDGTYEIDLGDGDPAHVYKNLTRAEALSIAYERQGPFELKFSAMTLSGMRVSRTYRVETLGKPRVDLKQVSNFVQCVGQRVFFKIDVYNENTSNTFYTVNFGDGSEEITITNDSLTRRRGEIEHKFESSYCGRPGYEELGYYEVGVTAKNECGYTNYSSIHEQVVTPIHAAFTFDRFDGKNCTHEPIQLRNITNLGVDIDCSVPDIDWFWDFGNGRTSREYEPVITYEEAQDYNITLVATNNYDCASDTARVSVLLLEKVKADFKINSDTLCVHSTLLFENQAKGSERQPPRWSVVSLEGFAAPEIPGGPQTEHPRITFGHYGHYRVRLEVTNNCSYDRKDTIIVVQQDPGIRKFEVPEALCPPLLDMTERVGYDWNGNDPRPHWTVTRKADGQVLTDIYGDGTSASSEYPRFYFKQPGIYRIRLELKGVGCGGTTLVREAELKVYDARIVKDITTTPLEICENAQVGITSNSTGESLQHFWSYTPAANVDFTSGSNEHSVNPVLLFRKYGYYEVNLHLQAACGSADTSFTVHVKKEPNLFYFDLPAAICPGEVLDFQEKMIYQFNGNAEVTHWTITPAEGLEFLDGTGLESPYPKIRFTQPSRNYTFTVKLDPVGCAMEGVVQEKTLPVYVRSGFMTMEAAATDTTVCEGEKIDFSIRASAEPGDPLVFNWSVTPNDGTYDFGFIGSQTQVAKIGFNHWGTYQVKAETSGFCGRRDSVITVRIRKDPEVRLKDTSGICPGVMDMAEYVSYEWYNNLPEVKWKITPATGDTPAGGFEFEAGDEASLFPQIRFKEKGVYDVRVSLKTADCDGTWLVASRQYEVYDTTITLDMGPDRRVVCEGEKVRVRNLNVGVGLKHHWTVTGPEGGFSYEENTDADHPAPVLLFTKYGEYELTAEITGTCNAKRLSWRISVRGVPDIVLAERMEKICAGSGMAVDISRYLEYRDRKNALIQPAWSVTPAAGVTWEEGYGPETDFPRLFFTGSEHYVLTLEAASACAPGGKQVFHTAIDVIRQQLHAAFSVGKDSVGCTDDPAPYRIQLENQSDGDSLSYTWEVFPENESGGGYFFAGGDATSAEPALQLSEPGFYTVRLKAENICGSDDSLFRLKAFARPEVAIADVGFVCEPYIFAGAQQVVLTEHNDPVFRAEWQITPDVAVDNGGGEYMPGFTATSFYPDIRFRYGLYQVRAMYYNRCQTPVVRDFQVQVDRFIPIEPLADQEICAQEAARLLTALPAGGSWSFRDASAFPEAGDLLYADASGNYYFHPLFGAYEQREVELIYRKDNGSCMARDTLHMQIWPLPYVDAGETLEMCLNHNPRLLTGLDSAVGSNWQTNRGTWTLEGNVLAEHLFPAMEAGDFRLTYAYTDLHACTNRDSVMMTVHPLPVTDFSVADQSCIHTGVVFTPADSLNNRFEWSFGDNSPHGWSEGEIRHTYDVYGYQDVICRAESQYHCKDTSAPRQIEIINLPPPAFFDIDKTGDCPPFYAHIQVDKEVYKEDHNYLSFHWDYGEGTETDTLGPVWPVYYPAARWDTTYVTRFTVSNRCGTQSYDTTVAVYSVPEVSFALMHQWECSPVWLELQNTTTGNSCVFSWTFVNGRTGEVVERSGVRNPQYEFTTDSASTTYRIVLKAVNRCGDDEDVDSLVVKPRSISAHFTPLDRSYACVNEEVFFRNNSTDTVAAILNTDWDFGDGTRDTLWSPYHRYEEAGTYTVALKIDNGCGWDTVSSAVKIYPLPKLEIRSEDELCEADTFTFVLKSDQRLAHIEWVLGDGHRAYKDSLRYCYEGYGRFPVTVTGVAAEINQCADSVKKEVVVYNKPILEILPLDTIKCSPLLYTPEVKGEAFLLWDYGDGSGLTSDSQHGYENDSDTVARFQVKIYAETDRSCRSEYVRHVTLYNNPRAALDKEVVQGNPQQVTFINLSEAYTACFWELPLRGTVNDPGNQVEKFTEQGIYPVVLIAENYFGCRDTAELEHEVLIKGLYFPNTFIPHSQNGQVNRFNGIGMGLQEYKLEIFDHYGNKVWETQALERGRPSEGWDGCNRKGKKMPQGTYIWRAKAIFADSEVWTGKNNESGVPQTTQGTVLLLRE